MGKYNEYYNNKKKEKKANYLEFGKKKYAVKDNYILVDFMMEKQDKINKSANNILNSLTGEGTVRIFKNQILLLSGQEIETSDQVIILSSGGIAFYDKQGKNANTQLVFLEGQEEWVIQDEQGNYSSFYCEIFIYIMESNYRSRY